jgi:hypothetical protein
MISRSRGFIGRLTRRLASRREWKKRILLTILLLDENMSPRRSCVPGGMG